MKLQVCVLYSYGISKDEMINLEDEQCGFDWNICGLKLKHTDLVVDDVAVAVIDGIYDLVWEQL